MQQSSNWYSSSSASQVEGSTNLFSMQKHCYLRRRRRKETIKVKF
jgi:hypothetical protein